MNNPFEKIGIKSEDFLYKIDQFTPYITYWCSYEIINFCDDGCIYIPKLAVAEMGNDLEKMLFNKKLIQIAIDNEKNIYIDITLPLIFNIKFPIFNISNNIENKLICEEEYYKIENENIILNKQKYIYHEGGVDIFGRPICRFSENLKPHELLIGPHIMKYMKKEQTAINIDEILKNIK